MGLKDNLLHPKSLFSFNLELCVALHPLVMARPPKSHPFKANSEPLVSFSDSMRVRILPGREREVMSPVMHANRHHAHDPRARMRSESAPATIDAAPPGISAACMVQSSSSGRCRGRTSRRSG